jgi:hypothetical protein
MATNLDLDPKLVSDAKKVGGHKSKKEAVTAALIEYIKLKKRLGILELMGTIDYDENYDYKADRRRDNKRIPK